MAQPDIAAWAVEIKARGLLKDRGKGDQDWLSVTASDSSIFELRVGRVYTRVVWSEHNPPERPFAFWRFVSVEHPLFPKNEFVLAVKALSDTPEYLTAVEVTDRLRDCLTLKEFLSGLGPAPDVIIKKFGT